MQYYLASRNCLMKCRKHKKIVKYDVTLEKKSNIFIFPPKFYSSLKQQHQLLAYSNKRKKGILASSLPYNNSKFREMYIGKNSPFLNKKVLFIASCSEFMACT